MWKTSLGVRVLNGAEAELFKHGVVNLFEEINLTIGINEQFTVGVPLFDDLCARHQLQLLESVALGLLDRRVPAPATNALLESTVAAIYAQMRIRLSLEIECPEVPPAMQSEDDRREAARRREEGFEPEDQWYWWRRLVLYALHEATPQEIGPEDSDDVPETWHRVIWRLGQRVLKHCAWENEGKLSRMRAIATLGSATVPSYFRFSLPDRSLVPVGSIERTIRRIEKSLGSELAQAVRRRPNPKSDKRRPA